MPRRVAKFIPVLCEISDVFLDHLMSTDQGNVADASPELIHWAFQGVVIVYAYLCGICYFICNSLNCVCTVTASNLFQIYVYIVIILLTKTYVKSLVVGIQSIGW